MEGTGPDHFDGRPSPFLPERCRDAGTRKPGSSRGISGCVQSARSGNLLPMQPISPATWQLIRALYEPPVLADRLLGRRPRRAEEIDRIGSGGELTALLYLLP